MARRTDFLVSCLPRDEDHTELRTVVIDLHNSCSEDKQAEFAKRTSAPRVLRRMIRENWTSWSLAGSRTPIESFRCR
ncbi:unnamed protein product [Larinioides sclopetarius]|uniref:Uncharacterized protein n=1 Tax=Larinioides sclopetarius TaxID=280406 RepID=A0AAV2BHJ7_9ARAC